jgi:hypothetical protein
MDQPVNPNSSANNTEVHRHLPSLLSFILGGVCASAILVVLLVMPLSQLVGPGDTGVRHVSRGSTSTTAELMTKIDQLTSDVNYYSLLYRTKSDGVIASLSDPNDSSAVYYIAMANLNGSVRRSPYEDNKSDYVASIMKYDARKDVGGNPYMASVTLYKQQVRNGEIMRFATGVENNQIVFFVEDYENSPGPCFQTLLGGQKFMSIHTTGEGQTAAAYAPTTGEVSRAKADQMKCEKELGME